MNKAASSGECQSQHMVVRVKWSRGQSFWEKKTPRQSSSRNGRFRMVQQNENACGRFGSFIGAPSSAHAIKPSTTHALFHMYHGSCIEVVQNR